MESILIVDDELFIRTMVEDYLSPEGYAIFKAKEGQEALDLMERETMDVVLLDIMMPDRSGLDLIPFLQELNPAAVIIIMTAYPSMESAIKALKLGAYDFLRKPFEPEEITHSVRRAVEHLRTLNENSRLQEVGEEKAKELLEFNTQLQHQKQQTEAILANMVEGVMLTDGQGAILHFNESIRRILDLPDQDEESGDVSKHSPLQRLLEQVEAARENKALYTGNFRVEGSEKCYRAIIVPLQENGGAVTMLEDMTDLNRLSQLKSSFVARASHELSTPLTSIVASIDLLKKNGIETWSPEQKKVLSLLETQSAHLSELVADLLDMSKLEVGETTLSCEPLDIRETLQEVLENYRQEFKRKKLRVELRAPKELAPILADRDGLMKILQNLTSNAIKFTMEQGAIRYQVKAEEGRIRVEVHDTGIGIPAAEQDEIFERFHQVEPVDSRKEPGTGLGLAISKYLVELQNGEIGVESQQGEGSCFYFTLPIAQNETSVA